MATGTTLASPPSASRRAAPDHALVEYGQYIDQQLAKTGKQVQGIDIASGLMGWLAGAVAYLMLAAAADHWLFSGGLGVAGRWLALAGLLIGSGWYLGRRVVTPLVKRINPVFAAHTIERGRPGLKNSLINLLTLRGNRGEVPEVVYDALKAQAASGLASAPVEESLDRSPLVRFALFLLAAVVVAAAYLVMSPKDPLRSAARVILPWAAIDRPTRFTLDEMMVEIVETGKKFPGGNADVIYGQRVRITALVHNRGREVAEPITLKLSTADRTTENLAFAMETRERGGEIELPGGTLASAAGGGLQQSLEYTLTAGDAMAGPFQIRVLTAPSIDVASLDYDYPDYTRLPNRTLRGQGDVNALEGTRVTVHGRANQAISQAWLDLDCDGRRDGAMLVKGQDAAVSFTVALGEDRRAPKPGGYLLRFRNEDGYENPQPLRYRVDVTPDLTPEIAWEAPREIEQSRELPVNEALEVAFTAKDRDFDLARVVLRAEVETEDAAARRPTEQVLLDKPQAGRWTGEPRRFAPAALGYRAGETVLVWGEAADNRQPQANKAETPKLRIKLLPPKEQDPQGEQPRASQGDDHSEESQQQNGDNDRPPKEKNQEQGREGDQQENQPQAGGNQPREGDQSDQAEQNQQQGENATERQSQQGEDSAAGAQQQPNEQGQGEKQPGQIQQQKQPGNQSGDAAENQSGSAEQSNTQTGQQGDSGAQRKGGDSNQGANSQAQVNRGSDGQGREEDRGSAGTQHVEKRSSKQGEGQPSRRVDPDAQDGEAFENMLEHFRQKEEGDHARAEKNSQTGNESAQGNENADDSPDASQQSTGGDKEAARNGTGQEDGATAKEKQPGKGAEGQQPQGVAEDQAGSEDANQEGERQQQGEQERGATDTAQPKQPMGKGTEAGSTGSEQPVQEKPAGAEGGNNAEEPTGTPEAQGANRERDQAGQEGASNNQGDPSEAQSPSTSRHETNAEGSEAGDQSGDGDKGGGQESNQEGAGSAGSNTEADEGAGKGTQSGDGATGDRGGDDERSTEDTHDPNAGKTQGQGETSNGNRQTKQPDSHDPQQGQGAAEGAPGQHEQVPQGENEQTGDPNESENGQPGQNSGARPNGGGGRGGELPPGERPQDVSEPGGDEANREYANKMTDLVLERLKDQLKKGQPDEALLDRLQWTKSDLERFVKRWEAMKAAAKSPGREGADAKSELDEALRGLGLRPRGTSMRAGQTAQDQARGMRDPRRSEPPAEYAEQYRQYNAGTSKGK